MSDDIAGLKDLLFENGSRMLADLGTCTDALYERAGTFRRMGKASVVNAISDPMDEIDRQLAFQIGFGGECQQ